MRGKQLALLLALLSIVMAYGTAYAFHVLRKGEVEETPDLRELSRASSTARTETLERKVSRVHAENVPALAVLLALAQKTGYRVGVELTPPATSAKLVSIDASGGKVAEVIDKIILADQRYTLDMWANYVPRQYRFPGAREVGATHPPKEPPPYEFTSVLPSFKAREALPLDAAREAIEAGIVCARKRAQPVKVVCLGRKSMTQRVSFSRHEPRVRTVINLIALAAGKSWIARQVGGKLQVQFFDIDNPAQVCPEVAKVQVELE